MDHYALRSKNTGKWIYFTWDHKDTSKIYSLSTIRNPQLYRSMSFLKNNIENIIYTGCGNILNDVEIVVFTEAGKKPKCTPNLKILIRNAEKRVIIRKLKT